MFEGGTSWHMCALIESAMKVPARVQVSSRQRGEQVFDHGARFLAT